MYIFLPSSNLSNRVYWIFLLKASEFYCSNEMNSVNSDDSLYTYVSFDKSVVEKHGNNEISHESSCLLEAFRLRILIQNLGMQLNTTNIKKCKIGEECEVVDRITGYPTILASFNVLTYEEFKIFWSRVVNIDQSGPCRSTCLNKLRILHQQYLLFKSLNIDIEKEILARKGFTWSDLPRSNTGVNANRFVSKQAMLDEVLESLKRGCDEKLNQLHSKIGASTIAPENLGLSFGPAKRVGLQTDSFKEGKLEHSSGIRNLRRHILDYSSPYLRRASKRTLEQTGSTCLLRLSVDYFADRGDQWTKILGFIEYTIGIRSDVTFSLQIFGNKLQNSSTFTLRIRQIFQPFWEAYSGKSPKNILHILSHIQSFTFVYPDANECEPEEILADVPIEKCTPLPEVAYYIWLNIQALNMFRKSLMQSDHPGGIDTMAIGRMLFFVSCSNDMDISSVASLYLLADAIIHPRVISNHPVTSYLMYLHQIPMIFSLKGRDRGSHALVHSLLSIGSQTFLCSDNALQKYFSEDPLQEEYDSANQTGMFDSMDMHEMCVNSLMYAPKSRRTGTSSCSEQGCIKTWLPKQYWGCFPMEQYEIKFSHALLRLHSLLKGRQNFRQSSLENELKSIHVFISGTSTGDISKHLIDLHGPRNMGASSGCQVFVAPETRDSSVVEMRRVLIFPKAAKSALELRKDSFPNQTIESPLCTSPSLPLADMVFTMIHHVMVLRIKYMKGFYGLKLIDATKGCPTLPVLSFLLSGSHSLKAAFNKDQHSCKSGETCRNQCLVFARKGSISDRYPKIGPASKAKRHAPTGLFGCPQCAEGIPSPQEYYDDYVKVRRVTDNPVVQHLSMRRLNVLHSKFELHTALNKESESTKSFSEHRDLYRTVKIDTHCHLVAGMTAKELLDYMKEQFLYHADDVIDQKKGTTLSALQDALGIRNIKELTVDSLDVQADQSIWKRFDNFNSKYNPLRESALRSLFLKTSNEMNGRYLAEIIKRVFQRNLRDSFTFTEFRVSIYGRKQSEWRLLARWFANNGMASISNKFLIQIPRIYHVYRKRGEVTSFAEFLDNIFRPLWNVSIDPMLDPELHNFLQHVSGFDSVDNESDLDTLKIHSEDVPNIYPEDWTYEDNPPYWYWMYYMHVNIKLLNCYREGKGMSTLSFRPHCGESGSPHHLIDGLLLTSGISHGINLRKNAPLQYLYYLTQIGVAVSPLSNNALWLQYIKNPFPSLFRRGLAVSLSSDDPLMFHHTTQPLIEEYAMASKIYHLTSTDTCEIAKTSVLTSGFDDGVKMKWLGEKYFLRSSKGNKTHKSHVPDTRCAFRFETYHDEVRYLEGLSTKSNDAKLEEERRIPPGMFNIDQELQFLCTIQNLRTNKMLSGKL